MEGAHILVTATYMSRPLKLGSFPFRADFLISRTAFRCRYPRRLLQPAASQYLQAVSFRRAYRVGTLCFQTQTPLILRL
jgi:hypothetical protein